MKYSTRLSDAVHLLVFIHFYGDQNITSKAIAESVKTNPSYIRQLMSALKAAGILLNTRGIARPSLSRIPEQISLYDIYQAVEGSKPLLHLDTHTNPECGVGVNIQLALQDYYDEVQEEINAKLKDITLNMIIDRYHDRISKLTDLT